MATARMLHGGKLAEDAFSRRLRALTALTDADLTAIGTATELTRQVRARAEVIPADTRRAERIHVLLDGWACRYRLLADGRRQITALLIPGDICDLPALHARHCGFAVATLSACRVASLDKAKLRIVIGEHPRVAEALGRLAAVDTAVLAERNASLGRRSAREQLAHLLCELTLRTSVVGLAQDMTFALRLTQEEIADTLGLTAVHVNRMLQGLRGDGLIAQHGTALTILDWDGLKRAAGFRPDYLHLDGMDGSAGDPAVAPWSLALPPQAQFASV